MKRMAGLALNEEGWGVVELELAGSRTKITQTFSGTWRSPDMDGCGLELRRICLEHGLPRRIMIAVSIVGSVWTKLILPPVPDREIEPAIRGSLTDIQASPDDWMVYEFIERGEKLTLRVAAMDAREIAHWVEVVEEAGIEPEGFILQAQAITKALTIQNQSTMFLAVTEQRLEMGLAVNGALELLRTIQRQTGDAEEIHRELTLTRHAWTREGLPEPDEILLLGKEGGFSAADLGDVWGNVRTRRTVGLEALQGDPALIAAYGAAQSHGSAMVWHPVIMSEKRRETRRTRWMAILTLILLMIGAFGFYRSHIRRVEAENQWINDHLSLYRELESLDSQDERLMGNMEKERSLWERRLFHTDYLAEWEKLAPNGTVLSSWSMDGNRKVEITGRTPSIALLLERLAKEDLFKRLSLKGAVNRNPKGWDEFSLSGELTEGAGKRK